jgi:hypothetical protein
MRDYRVLSPKRIPTKLPVTFTLVLILYVREFQIDGWVYGLVIGSVALLWFVKLAMIFAEDRRDPFNN